ncbi:MAG: hypothetical protein KA124_05455 [Luteimonas sp.]|nr:hypothetical protein [Luteimonas sp.]
MCALFIVFAALLLPGVQAGEGSSAIGRESTVRHGGIRFEAPPSWVASGMPRLIDNIGKIEFDAARVEKLLAESRDGSSHLATYTSHDPRSHAGILPTINVVVRSNPRTRFDLFKRDLASSLEGMSSMFENYMVTAPAGERMVGGLRAVSFESEYDIRTRDGQAARIVNRTIAIPRGATFIQISMLDVAPGENSGVFEAFLDSFAFD